MPVSCDTHFIGFFSDSEVVNANQSTFSAQDWRPVVIRLRAFIALLLLLVAVVAAIIVLKSFADRSLLYQSAFVQQATLLDTRVSSGSWISIITTLVAVVIGLWWGAMDTTFRRLQPYLSMAERPTKISHGAGLSYQSSYWIWAAVKAALNKHWLLSFVTVGTSLSPIRK